MNNTEDFEKHRRIGLDDDETKFVSLYLIFTPHTEFNDECKIDIYKPLVEAYEKIYLSELTRLKFEKMTKKRITELWHKAQQLSIDAGHSAINHFEELWNEQNHPKVMSIVSDGTPDSWKWHIELRMGNSIESTEFTKMKKIDDLDD